MSAAEIRGGGGTSPSQHTQRACCQPRFILQYDSIKAIRTGNTWPCRTFRLLLCVRLLTCDSVLGFEEKIRTEGPEQASKLYVLGAVSALFFCC
jgi:hypothetical protein